MNIYLKPEVFRKGDYYLLIKQHLFLLVYVTIRSTQLELLLNERRTFSIFGHEQITYHYDGGQSH